MQTTALAPSSSLSGQLDRKIFERYLDLVNHAISTARRGFAYLSVFEALRDRLRGRSFSVTITGDYESEPTTLGLSFDGARYASLPVTPANPITHWTVRRDHIHDVLDRPARYLADVLRIELPPFSLLGSENLFSGARSRAS